MFTGFVAKMTLQIKTACHESNGFWEAEGGGVFSFLKGFKLDYD